jgi:glycosyltransferase involved in cell wall biosynthesis
LVCAPGPAGRGNSERDLLRGLAASSCPSQVFSWQAARYAERLIEEEGIDLIEAQEWEAPLYYLQLRRRLGLGPARQPPCIVHLHSPTQMIFEHNEWDKTLVDYLPLSRFEEFTIRAADSLICPSHYLAHGVAELFGLEPESVTIVRYPMGETPVLPRTPEAWNRDAICYVGRLELRKGVVEWIDAAIHVAAINPSVSFDFFGSDTSLDGGSGESVLAHLKRRIPRSLRARFHFHGSQSRGQLLQSLATFSIAVVPSRWENLPYTCIEAMATGLPVIVSPHGGMPELIADGESGWVARDGSPSGLAEALTRALSVSATERAAMGVRATAAVRRMCANDVVVKRHLLHRSEMVRAHGSRPTMPPVSKRVVEEPRAAGKPVRRRFSGMALIQNPSAGFAFAWFLAAPLREKGRWIARIALHPRRIVGWIGWQMRQRVPESSAVAALLAAPTAIVDKVRGL